VRIIFPSLLSALLIAPLALSQDEYRNRLTFSGGWSRQVDAFSFQKQTAPGLGLSYGFRVHRHVEAEAGLFAALQPAPEIRGASYFLDPDDRFLWVPFGIRAIAPLHADRLELSAGGGGLYQKYSISNPNPGLGAESRHGWGGYLAAGAAVSVDRGRHIWLGFTPRAFLANPKYRRDRWLQWNGEISFRF